MLEKKIVEKTFENTKMDTTYNDEQTESFPCESDMYVSFSRIRLSLNNFEKNLVRVSSALP